MNEPQNVDLDVLYVRLANAVADCLESEPISVGAGIAMLSKLLGALAGRHLDPSTLSEGLAAVAGAITHEAHLVADTADDDRPTFH